MSSRDRRDENGDLKLHRWSWIQEEEEACVYSTEDPGRAAEFIKQQLYTCTDKLKSSLRNKEETKNKVCLLGCLKSLFSIILYTWFMHSYAHTLMGSMWKLMWGHNIPLSHLWKYESSYNVSRVVRNSKVISILPIVWLLIPLCHYVLVSRTWSQTCHLIWRSTENIKSK